MLLRTILLASMPVSLAHGRSHGHITAAHICPANVMRDLGITRARALLARRATANRAGAFA